MQFCIACGSSICVHVRRSNFLTRRELQMVRAVARGCTNKQIAGECGICEGAVKRCLHLMCRKLPLTRAGNLRSELTAWALRQQGLMKPATSIEIGLLPRRVVRAG